MRRVAEERLAVRELDDPAEVHHRDPVAHVPDNTEIVADEDEGQAALRLELLQKIQDLRAHRDVERGRALVRDHEGRVEGESTSDADSLTLAAAQFLRPAAQETLVEADRIENRVDLAPDLGRDLSV